MDIPTPVTLTVEQLWQPVPGGSGTYIRGLVEALRERNDVTLSGLAAWHPLHGAPPGLRVRRVVLPRRLAYAAWLRLRAPWSAPLVAPARGVLHATTWAVPPHRGPLVVTVHDLAFLRDPGHFTPHGNRFFRRALDIVRDEADAVVVPSEATAADCEAAGIDRARIHVIPHGVTTPHMTADRLAAFRARNGLERSYVLWTGTFEPRKNLPALLGAFSQVAAVRPDLDLVLVGPSGLGRCGRDRLAPARRSAARPGPPARAPGPGGAPRRVRGCHGVLLPVHVGGIRAAGPRGDGARRPRGHVRRDLDGRGVRGRRAPG